MNSLSNTLVPQNGAAVALPIIDPTQFEDCTALWVQTVQQNKDLSPYFNGTQRLLYASFSADYIINLVSAPTISTVKVRFGIINALFVVIAFASNNEGTPVSAYFLGTSESGPVPQTTDGGSTDLTGEVPQKLAEKWMANWAGVSGVTSDLFKVYHDDMAGDLRGYTFDADDFRETLFANGVLSNQIVRVRFALHEYVQPSAASISATFGLVLDSYAPGMDSDLFFDLSAPCPPTC